MSKKTRSKSRPKEKPVTAAPQAQWNAGRTNRAFGKPVANTGPNWSNIPYINLLRARVRDKVRNAPSAKTVIDTLPSEMIGTGIVPLPQATGAWKKELASMWDSWGVHADFDRVLDIYGLQALAVRSWKESGECFARFIIKDYDGSGIVPLRIQLLEADMVTLASGKAPKSDNEILNGIEFKNGERIAYWVYKKHPGDFPVTGLGSISTYVAEFNTDKMIRVPAEDMIHLYKPTRPGQLRGVPDLSGTVQTIAELADFDEATLEHQKHAAALTFFIRRPAPIDPGVDPVTGIDIDPDLVQESTINPGSAYTLLPGEEIDSPDLPDLGDSYTPFVKHHNMQIATGSGLPYELLTGDYSGTNDRTVRVALGVFRRKLQQDQWQHVIHQFCRPIWDKMIQVAVLNGLTVIKLASVKVLWNPQAWPYINPFQDVQTQEKAIAAGLTSRTATIMERGDDPEQVDNDRSEDLVREKRLKITPQETVTTTV